MCWEYSSVFDFSGVVMFFVRLYARRADNRRGISVCAVWQTSKPCSKLLCFYCCLYCLLFGCVCVV